MQKHVQCLAGRVLQLGGQVLRATHGGQEAGGRGRATNGRQEAGGRRQDAGLFLEGFGFPVIIFTSGR